MRKFLAGISLVIAWAVIFAAFAVRSGGAFATADNFETIIKQAIVVGFGAIGMTFIIISGGIDLSAGSMVALVTVVIAKATHTVSPGLAALVGIGAAGLCGLFNGVLVAKGKMGPFIVTLAMLLIYRGLAVGAANQQKVNADITWLNDFTAKLGPSQKWQLLPTGAWLLLIWAGIFGFILTRTVFGRNVVAVGSNEVAARLAGIKVEAVRIGAYLVGGLSLGMAGLMMFSRLSVGDPTAAEGLELDMIASVVIGGGSLSGGVGSLFGSLIGVLIMATIRSGCSQMGLDNWIQQIVTGSIIMIAVAFDRLKVAQRAS